MVTATGEEAERRQLTVLFCDMVRSTEIAAELGPEDWREVLREYQRVITSVVELFDGFVAQYLGDGVVAYFGHPNADEDDAERAVRAGRAMADALSARGPALEARYGQSIAVRVGIHTGQVVVGEIGSGSRRQTLAVGAATNVAARVQAEARPGSVLISSATLRLVRGIFATDDLGPHDLKGLALPVDLYRVTGPTGASTRLEAASMEGLTPFVGRDDELGLLGESWQRSREGRGQVVLIEGDAGIGKSRFVQVFRDRLADEPHRWIECRASKFHRHTAFHPLSKLLEETLGLDPEQSAEQRLSLFTEELRGLGLDASEAAVLFASLLGAPQSEQSSPFAATAGARRKQTLNAVVKWLLALATTQPVVLVIEDLHWLDSSSLDLLELLMGRVSSAPVLLLTTFRTSFEPPWALESHAAQVVLKALTEDQTDAMMMGLAGGASLPAAVRDQVVRRTDGVPLFIEEFTRTVLESGFIAKHEEQLEKTGPIPSFSVPTTLQDSLMARLDRLGPAKNVAQLAAVLGRDFSRELVAAVASDVQSLERDLSLLVSAGILQRTDRPGSASYTFKHALIQDTAYQSLLKAARRALHARVVDAMELHFAASAASEPERLAWHCEEGELIDKAVGYYQSAAEQAQQRSASAESIRHLSRGIELLGTLPENPARLEQELRLQIELGKTVAAAEGWGNADAEAAYQRARELCEHIGERPEVFQVIRGLVIYYTAKSDLRTANELAKRLTQLAKQSGEIDLLLPTHMQLGILQHYDGNPSEAVAQFQQAIALYDPSKHDRIIELYGEDLGVVAPIWMAWSQWLLGYPDRAVETCREAQSLGEQLGHQFTTASVFLWTSVLQIMRRDVAAARVMAGRANEISERNGFALLLSEGQLMAAWTRLQQPLDESAMQAAVAEFQKCVTNVSGTGIMANAPVMLGFLAEAYHRAGQHPMALGSLEAGFAISQATGQAQWDAELHRLKGEFLLHAQGDEGDVEQLFRKALEIAQSKKTLSLGLRAGVSLGRLWKKQGELERARELVAPIYARFTEGFECPDLVEARELLGE